MNQGAQANVSGNLLEHTVRSIFAKKGFKVARHADWEKNPAEYGEELLLTNARYRTIYSHKGTTEFLLISGLHSMKIRIECKWQQVSGSVDEKLPYLYLNCIEAMPEDWIIIIIDGNGWKQGSIDWIKGAVREKKYTSAANYDKRIDVMDLKDFITWANHMFKQSENKGEQP
jgi:hypothetical protein